MKQKKNPLPLPSADEIYGYALEIVNSSGDTQVIHASAAFESAKSMQDEAELLEWFIKYFHLMDKSIKEKLESEEYEKAAVIRDAIKAEITISTQYLPHVYRIREDLKLAEECVRSNLGL